jgi:hypothetical protein
MYYYYEIEVFASRVRKKFDYHQGSPRALLVIRIRILHFKIYKPDCNRFGGRADRHDLELPMAFYSKYVG